MAKTHDKITARMYLQWFCDALEAQHASNDIMSAEALSPVHPQAEAAAAAPDQVTSGSRVNSKVLSTMPNAAQVRAEVQKNTPQ